VSAAIETEGLTRGFAHGLAVDGVSFRLEPGQVLALLGPNGAGKTTTVRLLDGVLMPHGGWSRVLGLDPSTQGDEVRRRTGVLTENAGLDDRLTSRENLLYVARLRGYSKVDARRRVDELLERFGMLDRADDLTQGFSTGQRKRVALARALLHDPEVLFLDEPTSGLDPAGTRDVIDLIDGLAAEGRTIVMATHFLGEAGRLADRMAVLHRGRLRAYGSPDELAAGLWSGVGAELDLGSAADDGTVAVLGAGRAARLQPPDRCPPRGRRSRGPPSGGGGGRGTGPRRLRRGPSPPHPRGRLLRHRTTHRRRGGRARHRRLRRRCDRRPGRLLRARGRRPHRRSGLMAGPDWRAVWTIVGRDLRAVRRSKAIVLPMVLVPTVLLVALPTSIGLLVRAAPSGQVENALGSPLLQNLAEPILALPEDEQLIVLVLGYLLAPLLLVIPLMVSAVLAADAFAGEKERRTLEVVLHLPISDRDLFVAKVLAAFLPAVAITWVGALLYSLIGDVVAWPVMGRLFLPYSQFFVVVAWVAPALALLALGLLVIVSSRARTTQEANQLGGAVILPLIFVAAAQASTLLLLPVPGVIGVGAAVWLLAGILLWVNGRRFTRDRLAARV
jgi:ABC-type multidrug transport system ATPase subunit/ABC-type transport system involved in multi-copper enzyme maturation permease subunit